MRAAAIILFVLLSFSLFAQERLLKNQEFSFSIGIAEVDMEEFQPNDHLDFINYFDFDNDNTNFILLKLGYKFDFLSKMSADIKLVMMDDIIPDNYDIAVHYYVRPWLGIGVGSMLNKNWITSFEEYQINSLPNYYLMDYNVQQFTIYDLGFYLTPILKPFDNEIFKLQLACDLGMSAFMKEEAVFYHKKKLSNEKLAYFYETKTTFQPYIQPKIDIRLKAFKIKEATFGFLLNANYFYSKRSINYVRTIQAWTWDNKQVEKIKPSKHTYSRYEFNLGMFLKW